MKKLKLLCFIVVAAFLVFGSINNSYATSVVEEITGSAGNWIYTYTINNNETLPIWQWAVWFPTNPRADSFFEVTTGWDTTDLITQGFFPEEYTADWGDPVYDGSGDPLDGDTSDETLLVGPNGEPGSYNTYANDFISANPEQYYDGTWQDFPDPGDHIWRGGDWGWMGSGADIDTAFGIATGNTGQFSFHSLELISGTKSFSYNTIDYWYNICDENYHIHMDFEGSGTVVPEPSTWLLLFLGLVGMVGIKKKFS